MNTTEIVCDTPCLDLILSVIACRIRSIRNKQKGSKMSTFDRILKAQQEQRKIQREKDKLVVEAMFSNTHRPINNEYELRKIVR